MKTSESFAILSLGLLSLVRSASAADAPAPKAPPTEVQLFEHGKVDHAFSIGAPLLINGLYKVQTGRRIAPGVVEIHTRDTDVFYITDGSATFVTGGTAVDAKETGPGEMRAKSIVGGVERHLAKGDVIIIPKGIPHQFTEVTGPFLYFVVKVTEGSQ